MSKVFEYVIFDQLMTFLTDNKLFCMEQFVFRPGHSTELAVLRLVDHLTTEMDYSNVPTNVYIDLSTVFDSLNHYILLKQLNIMEYLVVHIDFFVVIYRTDHNTLTLMVICQQNCLYQLVSLRDRS